MSTHQSAATPVNHQATYPMAMALNYPTSLPVLNLRHKRTGPQTETTGEPAGTADSSRQQA